MIILVHSESKIKLMWTKRTSNTDIVLQSHCRKHAEQDFSCNFCYCEEVDEISFLYLGTKVTGWIRREAYITLSNIIALGRVRRSARASVNLVIANRIIWRSFSSNEINVQTFMITLKNTFPECVLGKYLNILCWEKKIVNAASCENT